MSKRPESRILSITPALPGWFSIRSDGAGTWLQPVALWALKEVQDPKGAYQVATSYSLIDGEAWDPYGTDDEDESFKGYRYIDPVTGRNSALGVEELPHDPAGSP
jgi:hypothetical protein